MVYCSYISGRPSPPDLLYGLYKSRSLYQGGFCFAFKIKIVALQKEKTILAGGLSY